MSMSERSITFVVPMRPTQGRVDRTYDWVSVSQNLPIKIIISLFSSETNPDEVQLLKDIAAHNPEYLVVLEHRMDNPGESRNLGLEAVITPWVAFVDSDDLVRPEVYLEWLNGNSNSDAHFGNFEICENGTFQTSPSLEKKGRTRLIKSIFINPGIWRYLFRTELAKSASFPNLIMGEDITYLARLNLKVDQISVHSDICYTYMKHELQLTKSSQKYIELYKTFKQLLSEMHNYNSVISLVLTLKIAISIISKSEINKSAKMLILMQEVLALMYISRNIFCNRFLKAGRK